jgi:tRNA1(Val) A37 N6-methylase TrmN6
VDVGAGVGTVGLAVALQEPHCRGILFEKDPNSADLARANVSANGLGDRVDVIRGDLFDTRAELAALGQASLIVTNPPFYLRHSVRVSTVPGRAAAHVLDGPAAEALDHGNWLKAALRLLAPNGRFVAIHRPDALPALLATMATRLGGMTLRFIHPRVGTPAVRVLAGGSAGSKAPATVLPPLTLHQANGCFTSEAEALHAGEPMAFWPTKNRPRRAGFSRALDAQ